jgi:hypothetical protein
MPKVTAPQAADILSTTRVTVFRWVDEGLLEAERITRRNLIMIDVDDLREFARANGYKFNEKLAKQVAE